MAPLPPMVGDEGEDAVQDRAALKDKLILLVIVLVIFHIGAFVSFFIAYESTGATVRGLVCVFAC